MAFKLNPFTGDFDKVTTKASEIGGLTEGSIPFADANGFLTEDNSNLFWDDTNNRLGIGTNTPNARLEIKGAGATSATNAFKTTDSNDCQHFLIRDDSRVKIGCAVDTAPIETLDVAGNQNFDTVLQPTNAAVLAMTKTEQTGGTLGAGTYYYDVYYRTPDGDTPGIASPSSLVSITVSANAKVLLENIPVSTDPRVTSRVIARTTPGGSPFYAQSLYEITDNTTTSWIDDGSESLDGLAIYRKANTTAGILKIDGAIAGQALNFNTAFGLRALESNTSGNSSVAFGVRAGSSVTTASNQTHLGYLAGVTVTTGSSNTSIGYAALNGCTIGQQNTAIGDGALRSDGDTNYSYNTAVGYGALNDFGDLNFYNTAIGRRAGARFGGDYNIFIGHQAGYISSTTSIGTNNILIGQNVGDNATAGANNNILIGKQLDLQTSNGDNQLSIGNLIFGTDLDGTGTTVSTGNIGIGVAVPTSRLEVNGAISLPIETITATDTLDNTNYAVLADATSGAITVNLPDATTCEGRKYTIKKIDSSTNFVTLDGNGSQTIDGGTTFDLETQHEVVDIMSDGSNWWII